MPKADIELKLADRPKQIAVIVRKTIQEARIFENYPEVHVAASFPAENMYLKRGYRIISYEKIKTENGDFLCYHTMERKKTELLV